MRNGQLTTLGKRSILNLLQLSELKHRIVKGTKTEISNVRTERERGLIKRSYKWAKEREKKVYGSCLGNNLFSVEVILLREGGSVR